MIIDRDLIQGEINWINARIGNPGATDIERLVTPKGKKVAASTRKKFLHDFVAEKIEHKKKETPN